MRRGCCCSGWRGSLRLKGSGGLRQRRSCRETQASCFDGALCSEHNEVQYPHCNTELHKLTVTVRSGCGLGSLAPRPCWMRCCLYQHLSVLLFAISPCINLNSISTIHSKPAARPIAYTFKYPVARTWFATGVLPVDCGLSEALSLERTRQ